MIIFPADFQVENEELRKELQEKQDLLCQAAKAMELMEDNERKTKETHSLQIADYKQKIQYLEVSLSYKKEQKKHI